MQDTSAPSSDTMSSAMVSLSKNVKRRHCTCREVMAERFAACANKGVATHVCPPLLLPRTRLLHPALARRCQQTANSRHKALVVQEKKRGGNWNEIEGLHESIENLMETPPCLQPVTRVAVRAVVEGPAAWLRQKASKDYNGRGGKREES